MASHGFFEVDVGRMHIHTFTIDGECTGACETDVWDVAKSFKYLQERWDFEDAFRAYVQKNKDQRRGPVWPPMLRLERNPFLCEELPQGISWADRS